MNPNIKVNIYSFAAGLGLGTVLTLVGGYFFGTVVVRRTMNDMKVYRKKNKGDRKHLEKAIDALGYQEKTEKEQEQT